MNLWESKEKKNQVPRIAQGIYKKTPKALTSEATSSFDETVPSPATEVNPQNGKTSLTEDSDGNKLSKGQQEFFS